MRKTTKRKEDPRSVAELEAIKVEAIASIRYSLQNIQSEGDPDDLEGNGEDTGNTDLPMLSQHAQDLSDAYGAWQDAHFALDTKPEYVEARRARHLAERAEEAEEMLARARAHAAAHPLTEAEAARKWNARPEARNEATPDPLTYDPKLAKLFPTSNVIPFPGDDAA
jgi:hypothetical protein